MSKKDVYGGLKSKALKRVLEALVEDWQDEFYQTAEALKELGIEVEEEEAKEKAIELLKSEGCTVELIDYDGCFHDGGELTKVFEVNGQAFMLTGRYSSWDSHGWAAIKIASPVRAVEVMTVDYELDE